MQFSKLFLAATACAVASAAKFGMTGSQFVGVTVGSSFNISWFDGVGPYTVLLKNGEANVLKTYSTIASGLTGTSFIWSIPSTLPVDTYAFEIDDASTSPINYSVRFQITGGPALSSSSTASSTGAPSSTATSSSSSPSGSGTTSATTSTTSSASSSNGTRTSTGSSSRTSSTSTSTATTAGSVSSAAGVSSPLALVLLAFAAIITLN